jgi:hypothetical protein
MQHVWDRLDAECYSEILKGGTISRRKCRWKDNIKIDSKEIGCDNVDWIQVAEDRAQWRALDNKVMKLRFP